MPPAKVDRRTERTRAALLGAFVDLMLSEGYDAVTVERIAERANVGRSTFYMHFTGKEEILRQSLTQPSSNLAIIVGYDLPPDLIPRLLMHFHAQRNRNHMFFSGPVRKIWVKRLAELIEPRLVAIARHARARPLLPLPLIALQIAEGQIALIANWLDSRSPAKTDVIAEALIVATRATLAGLLRCPPGAQLVIPGEKLRFMIVEHRK